jgi:hypothetical protein
MGIIGQGWELLKLVDKARSAELYKQLGEWIDKVTDLQRENETLREERDALKEQVRFKGVLERIKGLPSSWEMMSRFVLDALR